MKRLASLLFVVALLASCSQPPALDRSKAENDVREAVFRYQFQYGAPKAPERPAAYFLFVGKPGADPSDEFMRRFAGMTPPVKKGSKAKSDAPEGVLDSETGKPAVIFSVGAVDWIHDRLARTSGGYFVSSWNSSGSDYTLEMREGKWVVVIDGKQWK
jgi:hypothetical protein